MLKPMEKPMEKPIQFPGKDMTEEISFGTWLRQRRRTLDLTQKALAVQIGCAEITVRQIEADVLKPSRELAEILLDRLGIPEFERPQWIAFARGSSGYPQKTQSPSSYLEQKTNLPIPLTSFVGRERDVERIQQRLRRHRLVTLTGVGGIGKTRLAQQVGRQVLEEYSNGAWFVELASLNDPTLVSQTVATLLSIQPQSDRPIIDILIQLLRAKTTLLILDNCEHLLDACAQLADTLLKNCPNLKILATSREALGVSGEALFIVPPLRLPDVQQIEVSKKFGDYESMRLFEERAQLIQMDFALTMENASSIAQICRRLDGIPLAIELAAARITILQIEEILKQLNVCFSVLASNSRTELPQHQTLRASMDWSWNLLTKKEQIFMRQLSIFAGGWTLNSAQTVYEGDVLDLTSALVKKSLMMIDQKSEGETRYDFHEIVRQYMRERLIESGEEQNIRIRHLKYFLQLSERAESALRGPAQIEWMVRLNNERDNLRAALEWADKTDVEAGLYLSGRLVRFWESFDESEGARWLTKFLQKPESRTYPLARAKALSTQAWIMRSAQEFNVARVAAQECLELFRSCGDQKGEIDGLLLLGFITQNVDLTQQAFAMAQALGDRWRQAMALASLGWNYSGSKQFAYWEQAITLFRQTGDWRSLAIRLSTLGYFLMLNGDLEFAQKRLDEATLLSNQLKDKAVTSELLYACGRMAMIRGEYSQARRYLLEELEMTEELGSRMGSLWCRTQLGYLALREGNAIEARNIFTNTAQNFQKDGNEGGVIFALEGMAALFVALDKAEYAARLIGWTDMMHENIHDTRPLIEQKDVDKIIAACIAKMGKAEFLNAYNEGKKMTLEEAVAYALEEI
jgi:predicted ATPase/DNA-binding XRE family transcriptional regulator